MAEMSAWISVFFSILSMRARSTLRILPRMGRMAWVCGLRASLAEPPAELPSTMNSSLSRGSRDEQSTSLPGQAGPVERRLAPGQVAGLLGGHPGPGGQQSPSARSGWPRVGFSSSHSASFSLVARSTSERIETLPSLALVWPSNCGSRSRTETMAVRPSRMSSPRRFSSFSFSRSRGPGVRVDHVGQGLLEPLLVHAALDGGDAVGEGVDALVVAGVPLQGDLDLLVVLGLLEGGDLAEQRLLRGVEVLDEVDDAAGVLEGGLERLASGRSSTKRISRPLFRKAMICRRSMMVWARNSTSSKMVGVRPEGDRGPGPAPRARGPVTSSLPVGLPPLANSMHVVLAVAVDLERPAGSTGR